MDLLRCQVKCRVSSKTTSNIILSNLSHWISLSIRVITASITPWKCHHRTTEADRTVMLMIRPRETLMATRVFAMPFNHRLAMLNHLQSQGIHKSYHLKCHQSLVQGLQAKSDQEMHLLKRMTTLRMNWRTSCEETTRSHLIKLMDQVSITSFISDSMQSFLHHVNFFDGYKNLAPSDTMLGFLCLCIVRLWWLDSHFNETFSSQLTSGLPLMWWEP